MKRRRLGKSNLFVSELALGSIYFGTKVSPSKTIKILDYATERGVNLVDTSEVYPAPFSASNYGNTERIIGKWLKTRKRDSIIISTKAAGPGKFVSWIRGGNSKHNLQNLRQAIDGSLKRLGTDYIDIFHLNWPDRAINSGDIFFEKSKKKINCSIEETVDALLQLIKEGKIRYFGVSNETPWGISQYLKFGSSSLASIQNPLNLLNRGFEISHAEMIAMENLSLLAYSPLAGGLLGQNWSKVSQKISKKNTFWLSKYTGGQNLLHLSKLNHIAEESGLKINILALQYLLSFSWVGSAIIGCSTIDQCRQNFINVSILDKKVYKKINRLHKERMPPCN